METPICKSFMVEVMDRETGDHVTVYPLRFLSCKLIVNHSFLTTMWSRVEACCISSKLRQIIDTENNFNRVSSVLCFVKKTYVKMRTEGGLHYHLGGQASYFVEGGNSTTPSSIVILFFYEITDSRANLFYDAPTYVEIF